MPESRTRFRLLNDKVVGIEPDWYHLFEPTVELEIRGKPVLEEHANSGVKNVIIFVFMEYGLKLTERMIAELESEQSKEYSYWFTGTGHGLRLRPHGNSFDVELVTNPALGPVAYDSLIANPRNLGSIGPVEWVQAIAALGEELTNRFKHYPDSQIVLENQERRIRDLQSWLRLM